MTNAPESPGSNTVTAGILGIISGLILGWFRWLSQRKKSKEDTEVGLATLHSQGTQDLLDRYENMIQELTKKVEELEQGVDKLKGEIFDMSTRHRLELAALDNKHVEELDRCYKRIRQLEGRSKD